MDKGPYRMINIIRYHTNLKAQKIPYTVYRWTFNKYLVNASCIPGTDKHAHTQACSQWCGMCLYIVFINALCYVFQTSMRT